MQAPIPIFKRKPSKKPSVRVFLEGKDVTPRPLATQLFDQEEREIFVQEKIPKQSSMMLIDDAPSRAFRTYSISKLVSALYKQTFDRKSFVSQSFITSTQENLDDLRITDEEKENITTAFIATPVLPKERIPAKMPANVSISLVETETQFLLDLPSKTVDKLSDVADAVEQSNARYHFLTVGKGRNRKMVNAETQTTDSMRMPHATEAIMTKSKQSHAFASVWDMYDTYLEDDSESKMLIKEKNVTASERSVDTIDDSFQEDREILQLLHNERFYNAVHVLERLLSNNCFNAEQKRFRGLSEPDPFRENVEYNYRLDLLWTFANEKTKGQRIAAIAWNPVNADVLAVGYGKFYFTDRNTGMVLLWNIKNPVQPEREYVFDSAVTSVGFAKQNPNLLAIGFYDGIVRVLDVSSRETRIIGQSSVTDSPCIEPVWKVVWYMGDDYYKEAEQVITITEDGRINKYRARDDIDMECIQIMRIAKPEGKLKGIDTLRRCPTIGIPITRYSAALAIRKHPVDPNIYFIGTNEGTVHKCSRNYYTQHLDLFLAHNGPIYLIKFSPFCNKLFLTCGDDWMVRIWADGIVEPLLELSKTMQSVQGADWSPTHSTIIANICGSDVYLWDLQRKTYLPQSITHSPTNSRNTVVQFNESGRCLVVGDIDGNVHLFSLEDMPMPAFFQENLLEQSILKALVTKPHLIKKLKKLGRLSFENN